MKQEYLDILVKRIKKGLAGFFQPAPSCFDFLISLMLVINFIKETYVKEIFFVFYTLLLFSITFMMKPKREYKSLWLGILAVWSLLSVFIHSFLISQESITFRYKNMYLMSEGFIYILCGIILLFIIIKYSTNIKFLYFLSPLLLIPWFYEFSIESHLTPFVALFITMVIYCLSKKKKWIAFLMLWSAVVFAIIKHSYISERIQYKIPVLKQMFLQFIQHPFLGTGFNKTLLDDNMVFLTSKQLWLWRYNDFLNIGVYLGLIASICVVMFTLSTLRRIKNRLHWVLAVMMIFVALAQSIMFFVDKAVVYILLIGLFIVSSYKKEELDAV